MIDVIACPNCQRKLNLPPECEGQEVQCPGCKTQFRAVPQAPPVSPLAVTTPAFPAPPAVTVREEEIDPGTLPPPSTPRGRPRPLLRNAPRPSRSSGAKAVWMVPVGGVIVMTCLCGIFRSLDRGHHQVAIPPHVVVKQDDPKDWPGNPVGPIPFGARNDGPGFIVGLNPQLNAQMARDLAPLFKGLGDTLAARDQQRIASYLNPQRMVEEAIAQGMLADNPAVNRQDLGQRMADDLAKALQEPATLLPWNSSEVKHAASVGPSEAVVIVRHRNADGGVVTMRWWVTNRTGVWCVYDQEELNLGIRYTVTAPAVLAVGDNPGLVRRAAAQVRDARLAIAQRHDADSAEKLLAQTAGVALPQPLEVLRLITRISIELHQGRAQAALLTIDQWHALHLDTPLIGLFRGIAFNMLNQRDQALAHLRPYQQLVGDDALVCKELGDALRGLHRMQEAQKEYRTSLDCDPKNGAAFKGLVQALLPGDPREDLGRRFAKLDKPAETFEFLCENRRLTRDADSLEMLALAMRKIDPNCSAASYGLSLAKAWQGQGGEAVKAYQAALALEKDADKRRSFTTPFLMAMASCGLAHAAYPVAPDKRDAFGTLAGELKKFYRLDDMAPLVALHTKDDPADPLLPFYQAEVYVRRGQYEKADEAFGLGLADPPGLPLLDTFRDSRVLARYHVGKAMAAYNTIGPKEDTFRQLAAICLQDSKYELLTELLDAHAKTHPDLPDLLLYRCRMKVRQNAVAEAITLFKAGVAKVADERNRRQLVADFLLDMAQEGKAVEAYEAAPRASEAFDPLAYELRDLGRMDDLRRLLTAHGKAHPDDYRLSLHRGHLLLQEQKWPEAARELSEAWRRAPADQRIAVRFDYVEALYRMGRAREAYNTIEPRGEVFRQLAGIERAPGVVRVLLAMFRKQHQKLLWLLLGDQVTRQGFERNLLVRGGPIPVEAPAGVVYRQHHIADILLLLNGIGLLLPRLRPEGEGWAEVLVQQFGVRLIVDHDGVAQRLESVDIEQGL